MYSFATGAVPSTLARMAEAVAMVVRILESCIEIGTNLVEAQSIAYYKIKVKVAVVDKINPHKII